MTDIMNYKNTDHSSCNILYITLKNNGTIFWAVTPCSVSEVYQNIWVKYRLNFQDLKISQATRKNQEAGGNTFLRNFGKLIPEYISLQPGR